MLSEEIRSKAKQKMTLCRACKECNGIVCAGETPGSGGKGNGSSFITNVAKLKEVRLNMNVIASNCEVSTTANFFGKTVECPIYVAPIGNIEANYGAKMSEKEYTEALVAGVGHRTLVFSGDGQNLQILTEPLGVMSEGWGVPTIKPWQNEELFRRIDLVKDAGFEILCSDIDAAGLISLKKGTPIVEFKDVKALKEMVSYANCPVILKGIMTVEAACQAVEAGAQGIVVSNHGGRVLQDTPATIEVLEKIVQAVDGRCKVFVDGGFRTGYDVFKALALGADGVLIGRPFSIAAIAMREKGVADYLTQLQNELKEAMAMTGCRTIEEITRDCVDVVF